MFTNNMIIRGTNITHPHLFNFKILVEEYNYDFPNVTFIILLQTIIDHFFEGGFPSLKNNAIKMNYIFFPFFINIGYTTI